MNCEGQNPDKNKFVYVSTPYQLNEASVIDASPTPPTIGKSEEIIHILGTYKMRMTRKLKLKPLSIMSLNKKKMYHIAIR